MEQSDLLRFVVEVLERLRIRYFVTGSMASVFYGEPRYTNDIDIVVQLPAGKVKAFCRTFPIEDFYVSEEAAREAVLSSGQFNILHPSSGLKVDVIIPRETVFDRGRFLRSRRLPSAADFQVMFSSPEDVIIKKMEFYRDGQSEKHLRDIASMLKVSGNRLDRDYIEDWANRFGLVDVWRKVSGSSGGSKSEDT